MERNHNGFIIKLIVVLMTAGYLVVLWHFSYDEGQDQTEDRYSAYAEFLKGCERDEDLWSGDEGAVFRFSVVDLNGDHVDELVTTTTIRLSSRVNMHVYTLDGEESVKPFRFEDGSEAVFKNDFWLKPYSYYTLCSKGHFHYYYNIDKERHEDVYAADGNTLIKAITLKSDSKNNTVRLTNNDKPAFGINDANLLVCNLNSIPWYLNNEKGRSKMVHDRRNALKLTFYSFSGS